MKRIRKFLRSLSCHTISLVKIFAIEQLPGLLEAVHVAIPPSQPQQRTDWISFLYHYVHMNAFLHRSEDYTAEDIDVLETHIESCYKLLVTRIGGAERGVTNYFHYNGNATKTAF